MQRLCLSVVDDRHALKTRENTGNGLITVGQILLKCVMSGIDRSIGLVGWLVGWLVRSLIDDMFAMAIAIYLQLCNLVMPVRTMVSISNL